MPAEALPMPGDAPAAPEDAPSAPAGAPAVPEGAPVTPAEEPAVPAETWPEAPWPSCSGAWAKRCTSTPPVGPSRRSCCWAIVAPPPHSDDAPGRHPVSLVVSQFRPVDPPGRGNGLGRIFVVKLHVGRFVGARFNKAKRLAVVAGQGGNPPQPCRKVLRHHIGLVVGNRPCFAHRQVSYITKRVDPIVTLHLKRVTIRRHPTRVG